jgi:hypothetical protein
MQRATFLPLLVSLLLLRASNASISCKQAQELGAFGTLPWGSFTSFADRAAKWLNVNAGLTTLYFKYDCKNPGGAIGKLHVIGNSTIRISINNVSTEYFSGIWKSNLYSKIPFTLFQAK